VVTSQRAESRGELSSLTWWFASSKIKDMFDSALGKRRGCPTRARRFFDGPRLEILEDRVLPSISDGWIVGATIHEFDQNPNATTGLVAVDPSTGAQTILSQGQYFNVPSDVFEDPATGMLYVSDVGQVDTTGIPATNPNYGFPIPYTGDVIEVDPNGDPNSNQTRVAYNSPDYGEYLYGTVSVVVVNNLIYVINQGDGGGNLTTIPGNPVVHDLVQIDPTTGIQTRLLHGDLTADYLNYGGPHDPSNTNPPGWLDVPVRMVPVPNDPAYVYVADEQGRFDESHISLPGAIWKVNINPNDPNFGQATVIIQGDAVHGPLTRPIHLAVDQAGNILVLGLYYSLSDSTPTIVSYDPTTYALNSVVSHDSGGSLSIPTTITVNQQATPYDPPGAIYVGTLYGQILKLSGGIGIPISSGGYLGTMEKVIVYHSPGGHAAAPADRSSGALFANPARVQNAGLAPPETPLSSVPAATRAQSFPVMVLSLSLAPAGGHSTDLVMGSASTERVTVPRSALDSLFADERSDLGTETIATQII
jgi:hypothetical protein